MPITLLHLGLLAPLNHWLPGRVSNPGFLVTSVWLDFNAALTLLLGVQGLELHSPFTHSFAGALLLAGVISLWNRSSRAWVWGCLFGGISHILLDMWVHIEMQPLYPFRTDNPFYVNGMTPLSLLLCPLLVWLIAQHVSAAGVRLRTVRAERS